jgi:hypothetical protein
VRLCAVNPKPTFNSYICNPGLDWDATVYRLIRPECGLSVVWRAARRAPLCLHCSHTVRYAAPASCWSSAVLPWQPTGTARGAVRLAGAQQLPTRVPHLNSRPPKSPLITSRSRWTQFQRHAFVIWLVTYVLMWGFQCILVRPIGCHSPNINPQGPMSTAFLQSPFEQDAIL